MSDQSWNVFDACYLCEAGPGEPCLDLRVRHVHYLKHPHRRRKQLAVPLVVERDPNTPWRSR